MLNSRLFESASSWMLCSIHHQLSQSTTRNQKDIILYHFRKECNCNTNFPEHDTKPKRHYPASFPERMQLQHQLFQSTTRNQKDIILNHFRKEWMLCSIRVCLNLRLPGCYVQFAFVRICIFLDVMFNSRLFESASSWMLCSMSVCLNLHLPGCYVQFEFV